MHINYQSSAAWLALVILGILLVIAGFQGSAGRLLAVVFAPDKLEVWHTTAQGPTSGTTSPVQGKQPISV